MDAELKVKMLTELSEKIAETILDIGEKYGVDIENDIYYTYLFGLWNGEDQDAFVADIHVNDMNEMNYCIEKIEEIYAEHSLGGLLDGLSLN